MALFPHTLSDKISDSKGSRPYISDNAKRQFDVMGGWVDGFEKGSFDVML